MPEFQGMEFPDYVFVEWPKWVRRANGEEKLCGSRADEEEWLAGEPPAADDTLPGMKA